MVCESPKKETDEVVLDDHDYLFLSKMTPPPPPSKKVKTTGITAQTDDKYERTIAVLDGIKCTINSSFTTLSSKLENLIDTIAASEQSNTATANTVEKIGMSIDNKLLHISNSISKLADAAVLNAQNSTNISNAVARIAASLEIISTSATRI